MKGNKKMEQWEMFGVIPYFNEILLTQHSDDVEKIEEDIDGTDVENVDAEMTQIEMELEASLDDL